MLLIAKDSFRELVGARMTYFVVRSARPRTPPRDPTRYSFRAGSGAAIDAAGLKRIAFTNFDTNVTLGPVTVHLPDLAVLA